MSQGEYSRRGNMFGFFAAGFLGRFLLGTAFVFSVFDEIHVAGQFEQRIGELVDGHSAEEFPMFGWYGDEHSGRDAGDFQREVVS